MLPSKPQPKTSACARAFDKKILPIFFLLVNLKRPRTIGFFKTFELPRCPNPLFLRNYKLDFFIMVSIDKFLVTEEC